MTNPDPHAPIKNGGYTAVVLNADSRAQLLAWAAANIGPAHVNLFAHHMTVKFQPSRVEVDALPIGQPATLRVVGFAADGKGQAVRVESSVPSTNAAPHVTVAVAEGTKPVYSNELLKGNVVAVDGPTLTGTVEYVVPGKK